MELKPKIEKSIFQVRYNPTLSFYDKLYKSQEMFDMFPHWQTDRLKITLRDYDKRHSLTIKHDNITFETDKYIKKISDEIEKKISDNIYSITKAEDVNRLGNRFLCLIPVEMDFNELVEILNMKIFSIDFMQLYEDKPNDNAITITSKINDYNYRIQIGPMKNEEIPSFIRFNLENHIDPNTNNKYTELSKLIESYPLTSVFIDMDIFLNKMKDNLNISEFYNEANRIFTDSTKKLIDYMFKNKL